MWEAAERGNRKDRRVASWARVPREQTVAVKAGRGVTAEHWYIVNRKIACIVSYPFFGYSTLGRGYPD